MITQDSNSRLLNVSEVAAMLHVHNNTLRQWTNRGLINTYRIGKRGDRRFKLEDVLTLISKSNCKV